MTPSKILAYGTLGLPLAFAALPIYVHIPHFYAKSTGLDRAVAGLACRPSPAPQNAGRCALAIRLGLHRLAQSTGRRRRGVAARFAGPDLPRFFGGDRGVSGLGCGYRAGAGGAHPADRRP